MVTIADIARATRHSTATVDRVLNNRPGVREDTLQAILKAAALNPLRMPTFDNFARHYPGYWTGL
ncbi:hypothetical protein ABAC460_22575 [Asticcacaulis sp. AC460]|uniref:LacI family DNA-binding transcriptional regulator n=1 Tax=Asticcacaulis sp. AC460 TaxID=1282360 RepID=UPI0003C3F01A|nr:helix-turn-helix domain-containing protein [Asticcacaulis sp. AC460]ESQ86715.1 hypothetical protein ABAC460_22575 [Asticcacaulis sp. AC460]